VRCQICDKLLSDYEATWKHHLTEEYLDLCSNCARATNSITEDNLELMDYIDLDNTEDDLDWHIDNEE